MAYQTLCHRFSMTATLTAAPIGGALLSAGVLSGLGSVPPESSINIGWNAGLLGWLVGGVVEEFTAGMLKAHRVGVTRGSRIVQAVGLSTYGCVFAAAMSLNSGTAPQETSPQPVDMGPPRILMDEPAPTWPGSVVPPPAPLTPPAPAPGMS